MEECVLIGMTPYDSLLRLVGQSMHLELDSPKKATTKSPPIIILQKLGTRLIFEYYMAQTMIELLPRKCEALSSICGSLPTPHQKGVLGRKFSCFSESEFGVW
jgi:hypothetical protein